VFFFFFEKDGMDVRIYLQNFTKKRNLSFKEFLGRI